MNPYILAVTGASAQPLAERSLQLLLENDRYVHLIISQGAHELWKAEKGIVIPGDPSKQEIFWRNRLNVKTGKLDCHRWNDHSASIASAVIAPKVWQSSPAAWAQLVESALVCLPL